MTWNPNDSLRQTNTRGKRPGQLGRRAPLDPLPEHTEMPEAMPTILAGMTDDTSDEGYEQRLTLEQEREFIGQGFVPERHWNLVRQWMFRGTTAL